MRNDGVPGRQHELKPYWRIRGAPFFPTRIRVGAAGRKPKRKKNLI